MPYKTLLNITKRQEQIVDLVFKFRFINRHQIQKILNHKDPKRINVWLKDLVEKGYLGRIYSHKLLENTKPAIYYLNNNGILFIKNTKGGEYGNHEELEQKYIKKFYQDKNASEIFINHSIFVCQIYIQLKELEKTKKNTEYCILTKTEMWIEKQVENEEEDFATINNGGTAPFYQWYYNGLTIGNNQPELTLTNFNSNDSIYCILTSNDACATIPTVTSNVIHLSVNFPVPPTITQVNDWLYSSSAVSYQWYINGSLIPGATQVSYYPTVPGFYQVSISSLGGCSSISNIFLVSTVGLKENASTLNNIHFYPNPVNDEMFIELPAHLYFQIKLFSIDGMFLEILFDGTTGSEKTVSRINTSLLANGIYFIKVSGQNGFYPIKLMVMH